MSSGAGARGNPSKSEVPMWIGGAEAGEVRITLWQICWQVVIHVILEQNSLFLPLKELIYDERK